jgi:hypothetical protein
LIWPDNFARESSLKRGGWTLVENLLAATSLVAVSAAVGSAVTFSAARTAFEKQRSVVVSGLRSDYGEVLAAAKQGTAPVTGSSSVASLPGAPGGYSIVRTVTADASNLGRYFVNWVGQWETSQVHTVRINSAVVVDNSSKVSVLATGTFGQNLNVQPGNPTIIDLAARGIKPGDRITLSPFGTWSAWGSDPPPAWLTGLVAIFSSSTVLDPNYASVERVPGKIALVESPGFVTNDRWNLIPLYPSGTFQISANNPGLRNSVTVTVPTGARYLFVASADIQYFTDNRSHVDGWGVRITKVVGGVAPTVKEAVNSVYHFGSYGFNGLSYGYFESSVPQVPNEDMFRPLTRINDAVANEGLFSADGKNISSSAFWTLQGPYWMHPNGGAGRSPSIFHVVTRRWTTSIPITNATVYGHFKRYSANSNGVDLAIYKNRTEIWSGEFVASDPANAELNPTIALGNLVAGDWIEFRLGPKGHDGSDSTEMWFSVWGTF